MIEENYPSVDPAHRRADFLVHLVGLVLILGGSAALLWRASGQGAGVWGAVLVYVLCILFSILASTAYHFLPWPEQRRWLRRVDHAAIYFSIVGTFTPIFVIAGAPWVIWLLALCWALALLGAAQKVFGSQIKARWSTAAYLILGALGGLAVPGLSGVPALSGWCILAGALAYVVGAYFYSRKALSYRYAIWHSFVNLGGLLMFFGVWWIVELAASL